MEGTNGAPIRRVSSLIPAISVCVCVLVAGGCFGADAIGGENLVCCVVLVGWFGYVCCEM